MRPVRRGAHCSGCKRPQPARPDTRLTSVWNPTAWAPGMICRRHVQGAAPGQERANGTCDGDDQRGSCVIDILLLPEEAGAAESIIPSGPDNCVSAMIGEIDRPWVFRAGLLVGEGLSIPSSWSGSLPLPEHQTKLRRGNSLGSIPPATAADQVQDRLHSTRRSVLRGQRRDEGSANTGSTPRTLSSAKLLA